MPRTVIIAFINGNNAAFGELQRASHRNIMILALGNGDKLGQVPLMVQADMEFHSALGGSEICPWKDRKAKINGRGIE